MLVFICYNIDKIKRGDENMTFHDIQYFLPINEVEEDKVNALVESMLANGWQGCPILTCGDDLLTGSHRIVALKKIYEMYYNDELDEEPSVLTEEIAEDVTEIVEESISKFEEKHGYAPDIDYSDIGFLLSGSWVEQYKDEIEEW